MSGLQLGKSIQWSPLIQVLILSIGTLVSFVIALHNGDVSLYLPFISETGAYSPEKCIFSMCLILGSFIGCVVVLFRFMLISEHPFNEQRLFFWFNTITFFIGVIAMLGLAGVAAFPMSSVFWAHLLTAAMYFIGSAAYFICVTITTYQVEGVSVVYKFRLILTIAITVLLFLLVICFPISLTRWHEHNDFLPALKIPGNEGFTLVLTSSILEWSIVAVIIAYTLSLIVEFRCHKLCIIVTQEPNKNIETVEDLPGIPENSNAGAEVFTADQNT